MMSVSELLTAWLPTGTGDDGRYLYWYQAGSGASGRLPISMSASREGRVGGRRYGQIVAGVRRRWRDYRTAAGRRPVAEFVDDLSDQDAAAIVAAMREVAADGLIAARHLRGEIYEVRVDADRSSYRILCAVEGRRGQVLLALEALSKGTRKTPPPLIALAERRLRDRRSRARR